MADSGWLRSHCYTFHAPPRPRPRIYHPTHTTPLHATTLRHTLTPSTWHVSKLDKIVFPKYFSQSWLARLTPSSWYGVWIPNLGAVPKIIIASVSLTHIPCLFACFYDSLSFAYAFFSTCVVSAAWFVFGFAFITTLLRSFFISCEFNTYLWHGALAIRMSQLICLSSFSICMFIILSPVYVYLNIYTQLPPLCICTYLSPYIYVYAPQYIWKWR